MDKQVFSVLLYDSSRLYSTTTLSDDNDKYNLCEYLSWINKQARVPVVHVKGRLKRLDNHYPKQSKHLEDTWPWFD